MDKNQPQGTKLNPGYQPAVGRVSVPPPAESMLPKRQLEPSVYDAGMAKDPYMAANLNYAQQMQAPPR
jgi:hypothetical protein